MTGSAPALGTNFAWNDDVGSFDDAGSWTASGIPVDPDGVPDANDVREDYLRARLEERDDGTLIATPVNHQDSSLLANLAAAQALVIRAPFAPAAKAGSSCEILRLPS